MELARESRVQSPKQHMCFAEEFRHYHVQNEKTLKGFPSSRMTRKARVVSICVLFSYFYCFCVEAVDEAPVLTCFQEGTALGVLIIGQQPAGAISSGLPLHAHRASGW